MLMSELSPHMLRRRMLLLWPALSPRTAGHSRAAGRYLMALVVLFAVLNAADLLSTFVGLHLGLHEGNPLMSGLLEHFGFGALIAYKLVVIGAVALGIRLLRSLHYSVARFTIWSCNTLVFCVVLLNVAQYLALV
jgi:hypothetical protein